MNAEEEDARPNELIVTGALFALLAKHPGVTRCEPILGSDGHAQTALYVWFAFMKSRYRVAVELDPDPEP